MEATDVDHVTDQATRLSADSTGNGGDCKSSSTIDRDEDEDNDVALLRSPIKRQKVAAAVADGFASSRTGEIATTGKYGSIGAAAIVGGTSLSLSSEQPPQMRQHMQGRALSFGQTQITPPERNDTPDNDISDNIVEEEDRNFVFNPSQSAELGSDLITEGVSNLNLNDDSSSPSTEAQQQQHQQRGDEMQEHAIDVVTKHRRNVFLTGRAGTGKSWTTKQIVQALLRSGRCVHVTAPTGMAAINVHGTTIHRWGGFGLGQYYSDFDRMMGKDSKDRVRNTDTLVLDEVSMISGHLFDVLECMVSIVRHYDDVRDRLKAMRENGPIIAPEEGGAMDDGSTAVDETSSIVNLHVLNMRWEDPGCGLADIPCWGGMQLVLVGDFFQLPPIPNNKREGSGGSAILLHSDELSEIEYNLKVGKQGTYAFQGRSWSRSNLTNVELTTVHRQVQDDGLINLLNAMREGRPNLCASFGPAISLVRTPLPPREDGIVPTELHSKNRNVDNKNRIELAKLPGDPYVFQSIDEVVMGQWYRDKLLRKHGLEEVRHMPYLWACIGKLEYPERWTDAKSEMESLEDTKKRLLAEEKYEEIASVRDRLKALEKEILNIEKDEKEKAIITPSSISKWLQTDPCATKVADSPLQLYDRVKDFQKQLKEDHAALTKHANDRFFDGDCRVGSEIELKIKAQVMLLWNLDIAAKLVNGSRGVVTAFVPPKEYRKLLQDELVKRQAQSMDKKTVEEDAGKASCPESKGSSVHLPITPDNNEAQPKSVSDELNSTAEPTDTCSTSVLDSDMLQMLLKETSGMSTEVIDKELRDVIAAERVVKWLPLVRFDSSARLILPKPFQKEFKRVRQSHSMADTSIACGE